MRYKPASRRSIAKPSPASLARSVPKPSPASLARTASKPSVSLARTVHKPCLCEFGSNVVPPIGAVAPLAARMSANFEGEQPLVICAPEKNPLGVVAQAARTSAIAWG